MTAADRSKISIRDVSFDYVDKRNSFEALKNMEKLSAVRDRTVRLFSSSIHCFPGSRQRGT